MNSKNNKRGMCHKNGTYPKIGLTEEEKVRMLKYYVGNKQRWNFLFSLPNGRDSYIEPPPREYSK